MDYTQLARDLRLSVVQNQFDVGNLTEDEALELLRGELTPGDPATKFDDSDKLKLHFSDTWLQK